VDIDKDVQRTFPTTRRFHSEEGQHALRNVLRAYAAYVSSERSSVRLHGCQRVAVLRATRGLFLSRRTRRWPIARA
jgi:hypothetical protein